MRLSGKTDQRILALNFIASKMMDLISSFRCFDHPPPSLSLIEDSNRFKSVQIRASSEEKPSPVEVGEMFADLKEKLRWDAIEDKSRVFLYGGGAIVAVWLSSMVVEALNSVPLLPKVMELVGLGYTGWFVYRYLRFKSSRKELASDIETLKKQIAGSE
ncbi:protein CURVATURE THYLAKOID 1A, chloroplastic-like [Eucalyptus grandis]|uniref:protein CURVATURE THYLAKOID 1A, chloroplastic-like n=1 Tax=Eucalyptus grandis TaxID=71139 RepID=UPI00192EB705|nr:protein CURVATURE THYLAKOID 1A, chloroplastic-like [Eucalyptus grandis]